MYCINCGAELSDGQKICPICTTRIYHPDILIEASPTYPNKEFKSEEFNKKSLLYIITALSFVSAVLSIIFNFILSGSVTWSGYVFGGILVWYLSFIFPYWFKKRNPAIFVPAVFAAAILLLLYIDLRVGNGWFLPFAFPISLSLCAIVTATATLLYFIKNGRLYIIGGSLMVLGIWTLFLEILIHTVFGTGRLVFWSVFPLASLLIFGLFLIIAAIIKPLKESLKKLFFL